jgi:glutamyl-tRNA synthetase
MSDTPVVTRFAPSPTGFLHIGGARTALFNWLFARHHGGRFTLRIEDTDRARSTDAAIAAILDGMHWLGLDWDGETVYQFARAKRHAAMANDLLAQGRAYRCYASPQELTEMREQARREGRSTGYDGRWRDRDPAEAPTGVDPVIRLKAPRDGETVVDDLVQGQVTVANRQLDDMVLLRADGTPTYMLSVVVDDHDMAISHVIRGDDHLTNAARQTSLYAALGWAPPQFAHIPLIHGADGAKLSKRHGALGIEAYRDLGYLPEALRNYLLRLGWSHGDDEIISSEQAAAWFDLAAVGKAAARFDMAKLDNLNGHYINARPNGDLVALSRPILEGLIDRALSDEETGRLARAMPELKQRAKTLPELAEKALFITRLRPIDATPKAAKLLDADARKRLGRLADHLEALADWTVADLETTVRTFADAENAKLGKIAQPLRAALTGTTASPGIFAVLDILGRAESIGRIRDTAD